MADRTVVYSMPYNGRGSPYFTLWHAALARFADSVVVRQLPRGGLFALLRSRVWGTPRRILCIHWSTELYGSRFLVRSLVRLVGNGVLLMWLKVILGVRVVWVLHNNYAHDYPHPWIDRVGRKLLGMCADGFVAQQKVTSEQLRALHPHKPIAYIPHSNYIGAYGPRVTDTGATRRRFGFTGDDLVCIVLGSVRPYKLNERIIDAFLCVPKEKRPRLKLWIVGSGNPKEYFDALVAQAAVSPDIRLENIFVPDEDIPAYLACADYSVSFFDGSELTSGSVTLSLSYGLAAIVRDIPGAERVENGMNGYVFKDKGELTELFAKLPTQPVPTQEMVVASVAADTWDHAAERYVALWDTLTSQV